MIPKDYIMRIVEQFVKALASIVSSRKAANYEEASEQIRMASRYYLKIDISLILYSSPDQILEFFRTYTNDTDWERCVLCGDLIYEEALLKEADQDLQEARRLKVLCLHLYITAIPKEQQFQVHPYFDKVEGLIEELKKEKLSEAVRTNLRTYQEFLLASSEMERIHPNAMH